ncbi:MAG: imidazole glycerol phosphate synthase subunit HisH, partial [Bacteroidetes bacterium]|nr:imidazole glycerol phosphate synthase subunit HisH [Bacteroidota bacterium]
DKVIFPGVGEASSAMKYLRMQGLDKVLLSLQQPVLGICLGMQLMCKYSEENNTDCLGVFDVEVKKFSSTIKAQKVPQMGWNTIYDLRSPLFEGVSEQSFVYYVHGYYAEISAFTIATTEYIQPYSAALNRGNFYGVQFHPEKSAAVGERIIRNFIERI